MGYFMQARTTRYPRFILTALVLAVLVVSSAGAVSAQGLSTVPPRQLYFTETGQTVHGPFLAYWLSQQSVERTGLPITPSVKHDDRWTQWFEYTRLEIHHFTGNESGTNVYVAPLGRLYADSVGYSTWHPAFRPVNGAGSGADFFEETGHTLAGGFRGVWNEPGVAAQLGMPISEEFTSNGTIYQFFEFGALSWTAETGTRFVPLGTLDAALNNQLGMTMPRPENAVNYPSTDGLMTTDAFSTERWIEISLSEFRMTAYVGDIPFLSTTIVTGVEQAPTVVGSFELWHKNRVQDMSGIGWDGQPYFEANVPWAMYFYQDYAIHGTTWRQTYGVTGSEGCVIPPNHIAEILFDWADIGTKVVVKP